MLTPHDSYGMQLKLCLEKNCKALNGMLTGGKRLRNQWVKHPFKNSLKNEQ